MHIPFILEKRPRETGATHICCARAASHVTPGGQSYCPTCPVFRRQGTEGMHQLQGRAAKGFLWRTVHPFEAWEFFQALHPRSLGNRG